MFHNLCDFIKDEMKELDRKIASGSKPSMQELEYADMLAHMKKSLLTVDAMEHPEDYGYNDGDYNYHDSYSRSYMAGRDRNARRDSMGRYAENARMYRDDESVIDGLHNLMEKAPDDRTRRKLENFIAEMKSM